MGLFDPKWFKILARELEITKDEINSNQVRELERIRETWNLPHDQFWSLVSASPGMTKIVLEGEIIALRKRFPRIMPKQMFALVFRRREMMTSPSFQRKMAAAQGSPSLLKQYSEDWDSAERDAIQNPDSINALRGVTTMDEFVFCVLENEGFWKGWQDQFGIGAKIDTVLGWQDPRNKK